MIRGLRVKRFLILLCVAVLPAGAVASAADAPPFRQASLDSVDAQPSASSMAAKTDANPLQPPVASGPTGTVRVPLRLKPAEPQAAPPEGWFYHHLGYGSDAMVHPIRLILDGGFGILQFDNRDNRLRTIDWKGGWHAVGRNMQHPIRAIQDEGWGNFLQSEVIPVSFNAKNAQYWPNYTLHLIGGGMSYTMMREWYEAHQFARPRLWAGATLAVYHVLNEVVENDDQTGYTTDPIADLYIFDPASILLFSHEGVNGFFSRRLHLTDWSGQPAIDPDKGTIENHGQHFSMKLAVPRTEHWSFLYYFGNHGEGGLSYRRDNGSAYSFALGFRANELVDLNAGTRTTHLEPSLGLFYDRNGSLLFSAQWANTSRYRYRFNAYPGLLRIGRFAPGLFVDANKDGDVLGGVTVAVIPLGVCGSF
jgi:hypothetical protein